MKGKNILKLPTYTSLALQQYLWSALIKDAIPTQLYSTKTELVVLPYDLSSNVEPIQPLYKQNV